MTGAREHAAPLFLPGQKVSLEPFDPDWQEDSNFQQKSSEMIPSQHFTIWRK
jgi:hypothetical protein